MAILRSEHFLAYDALGAHASTPTVQGFQGRKVMRVSCQQSSVSSGCDQRVYDNSSQETAVIQNIRSPLFNLPVEAWITTFAEKETFKDGHHVVVPSALKQMDPGFVFEAKALHQEALRSSDRKQVKFTAEKARQLRKELRATETFHDKWYHSAIASRLAKPEQ